MSVSNNTLEEAVLQERMSWTGMADALPCMVLEIDSDHKVLRCNELARDQLGKNDYAELLGENISTLFPASPDIIEASKAGPIEFTTPALPDRIYEVHANPVAPFPDRMIYTFLDVTELVKMREEMEKKNKRINAFLEHSPFIIYMHDEKGNILYSNPAFEKITGFTIQELVQMNIADLVVPEFQEQFHEYLEKLHAEGRVEGIVKLRTKDGREKLLSYDNAWDTSTTGIARGYVVDITSTWEERRNLKEQLAAIPEAIVSTDMDGNILDYNAETVTLLGVPQGIDYRGRNIAEFFSGTDRERALTNLSIAIEKGDAQPIEYFLRLPHGLDMPTEIKSRLWKRKGIVLHSIRDVSKSKEEDLTGLLRGEEFYRRFAISVKDADKERRTMLYIDLDGFKKVNDQYDHSVGNLVLKQVAQNLKSILRKGDLCGRLGGDEFGIMLKDVSLESAYQVAERIIASLKGDYVVETDEGNVTVDIGASIGISNYPDDGNDPMALVKFADKAMYQSKEQGRGKYTLWTSGSDAH